MKRSHGVHIDSFTTGFEDLTKRQRCDDAIVLEVARREKRYSTFEMDQPLMDTLKRLEAKGHFKLDHENIGYPWVLLVFPEPPMLGARRG